jgi:hypothetical protein
MAQIVVKTPVFFGAAFEFRHQISLRDADADVPRHRADDFFIVRRIRLAVRFFAEQNTPTISCE